MFVKLRIRADQALARATAERGIENIPSEILSVIINTMHRAETDEGFANVLDNVCANCFNEQTADGYDDLLGLFTRNMPRELKQILADNDIIKD